MLNSSEDLSPHGSISFVVRNIWYLANYNCSSLKICSLVQWMNIWNPLDYYAFNLLATIIFQAGGRELSNILNLLLSETIHNLLAFCSMKEIDRSVCNKCLRGTNNSSKYFWNRQLFSQTRRYEICLLSYFIVNNTLHELYFGRVVILNITRSQPSYI